MVEESFDKAKFLSGKWLQKMFRRVVFALVVPPSYCYLLLKKYIRFLKKSKHMQRYKNAAYHALTHKDARLCFGDLYYCFRFAGLSRTDSAFNALYTVKSETLFRGDDRITENGIIDHPLAWFERDCEKIRRSHENATLRFLTFLSRVLSLPQKIRDLHRRSPWSGDNSLKTLRELTGWLRRKAAYWIPALTAAVVFSVMAYLSGFQLVLNAYVDGERIGSVQNRLIVSETVGQIEKNVSGILKEDFIYPGKITYRLDRQRKYEYIDKTELYKVLLHQTSGYVKAACGIYVDDALVAVCESRSGAESIIASLEREFSAAFGVEALVANGIRYLEQLYPAKDVKTADEVNALFSREFHYDPDGIRLMEAGLREDTAAWSPEDAAAWSEGEDQPIALSFKTSRLVTYTESIPFETVYKNDPSIARGIEIVSQPGKDGAREVCAKIFYVDSQEVGSATVSSNPVAPAENRVILIGTGEDAGAEARRKIFIFPCAGKIADGFGGRTIFGKQEYHKGVDIPGAKGTPVMAGASGTVIFAGYEGDYGYLVQLDHGDGMVSYYAHLSRICVEQGDTVGQADKIGEIGSTGYSTGNHLHFEIRIDNCPVNPVKYVYNK